MLTPKGLSRIKRKANDAIRRTGLALRFVLLCAALCLVALSLPAATAPVTGIVSDKTEFRSEAHE